MEPTTDRKESYPAGSKIIPIDPARASVKNAQPSPAEACAKSSTDSNLRVVSKNDLNKRMIAGETIQIVNVLAPEHYNLGFIKGSKRIPLDQLDTRLSELDKSEPVVTYCASSECSASRIAAGKLSALGFNVRAYEGGIKEWKAAGLPMEE